MMDERNDPGAAPTDADDEQPRPNPAGDVETEGATRVLTLICEKCGRDYFFENEAPPADLQCGKCGGTVFRSFTTTVGDEAADDFRDSTERDMNLDDPEGDTLPGDLLDLKSL